MRLNKGVTVKNILREVSNRDVISDVDFILCMGDDIQHEKMFTVSLLPKIRMIYLPY